MALLNNDKEYIRIKSLRVINKQLRAWDKDVKSRFMCLAFVDEMNQRCGHSAYDFPFRSPGLMRRLKRAQENKEVTDEDFITIVRSMFCGHDKESQRFQKMKPRLQRLWNRAKEETQKEFLDAIRQGHDEILDFVANATGRPKKDIERAARAAEAEPGEEEPGEEEPGEEEPGEEEPGEEEPSSDGNNNQLVLYPSFSGEDQSLLAEIRKSVRDDSFADDPDRKSSDQLDTNTPGLFAPATATPSHFRTNSPSSRTVNHNHEMVNKNTSRPRPYNFASGTKSADGSPAHRPLGNKSRFSFSAGQVQELKFEFSKAPGLAEDSKPVGLRDEATPSQANSIFRSPDVAAEVPASTKEPKSPPNVFKTSGMFKFGNTTSISDPVTPAPCQAPHGAPSSRSPIFQVISEDVLIKDEPEEDGVVRDNRNRTPDSVISRFESGRSTSARISTECTPSPLADRTIRATRARKLPGMKHSQVLPTRRLESPSPDPPITNPTTPENVSDHDERPMVEATPKKLGTPRSNHTPRSEARTPPRYPKYIAVKIKDILRAPLNVSNDGYIYVLKAPQFFEEFPPSRDEREQWVKIGITRNMEERLGSLSARCGFTDLVECRNVISGRMPMPLLRLVEKLCHEELSNFSRPLDCKKTNSKCHTVHTEWFHVTEEVARRTVKRWLLFVSECPRDKHGFVISQFWRDRICDGEYLTVGDEAGMDKDLDRTHARFQAWLEASIQQYKTVKETERITEEVKALKVG